MEDLRYNHKIQSMHSVAQQIAFDCISTQSPHGSPYHVHPYPSPVRLQHAFQPPNHSPKTFYQKCLKPQYDQGVTPHPSPIVGRALCLTARDSPVPGRVSHLSDRFNDSLTLNSDTDAMVAKIGAMFPTVSDTHIRILLKKYHNREAVVISALQVEKHPLVTPGPLSMSPSAARLPKGAPYTTPKGTSVQDYYTITPNSSPSLFRPPSGASSYHTDGQSTGHHSPKMKLKYLKSIFPKADEMMILEILSNNDSNVQRVSEELVKRGFHKKAAGHKREPAAAAPAPPPVKKEPPLKTNSDKLQLKMKYQKQYPNIAERIISIALESVDYNETLTEQILGSVVIENGQPPPAKSTTEVRRVTICEPNGPILKSCTQEPTHRSNYTVPKRGPDPNLRQGPQDAWLLEQYLPWSGPEPQLRCGASTRPQGPAARLRPTTNARGPASLAKGPQGLAKGSTYHNNNKKSAKFVTT